MGYSLSDLAAWSRTSMPTVKREVDRAEQAGIVTTRRVGPVRLVRADTSHPLHDAVRRIVLATYGPPAVVAEEFAALEGADAVLLIGSWAARFHGEPGRPPNDVDVLVIGDADRDCVDEAAQRAERRIGLPVQAIVRTREQWESGRESFIAQVRSRPIVVVLVSDEDPSFAADLRRLESGAERPR